MDVFPNQVARPLPKTLTVSAATTLHAAEIHTGYFRSYDFA